MPAAVRPQLRGYQVDLVQRLRVDFHQHRSVLCVMPTGAGKTVVAGWLMDSAVSAKGKRVLFLAHRQELIDQCSRKLDGFGVHHGVIMAGHPRQDLGPAVQVASVQTLVRRLDRLAGPGREPFDLIVVDEAHHTAAGSYAKILEAWHQAKVLGLTATPYRMDGQGLGDLFEHLEVGVGVADLIRDGWLVRTRTFAPPPPAALATVGTRAGEIAIDAADDILNQTAPLQEIVDAWHERAAGRTTVAFACTVLHAQRLATAFRACGVAAAAIDGETPAAERAARLEDLAAGRLQVLANCALLTEGWDLPSCSAVIQARPTKSRALWRQIVGRGMRSAPGKADCVILDHVGNCHRFGCPDESEGYSLQHELVVDGDLEGQRLCPNCHALAFCDQTRCEECDTFLPRPATSRKSRNPAAPSGERGYIERKAIELEEARPMTMAERQRWYHARLTEAEISKYKPGWAAHRYLERFGAWPPSEWRYAPRLQEANA